MRPTSATRGPVTLVRGLLDTLPLTPGVVTFGLVYGVATRAVGLSPAETVGMSAPMLLLSRELPRPVFRWLQLVPVAILSALIAPAVFVVERRVALGLQAPAAVVGR